MAIQNKENKHMKFVANRDYECGSMYYVRVSHMYRLGNKSLSAALRSDYHSCLSGVLLFQVV
jgi:hypothetical protein